MAHPRLTRRVDRRMLFAAGSAAALLAVPALATPAAGAMSLGGLAETRDCTPGAVAGNQALAERCAEAGLLSGITQVLPEPLQRAVDPIEKVVDDVLQRAPAPVKDAVEQVPAVVEGVTDAVGVEEVLPTEVPEVAPEAVAAPTEPPAEIGAAGQPRPLAPQGPGTATPPFVARGVAANTTTTTLSSQPFAAPVVSGPLFGTLPEVAERFLTQAPAALGSAALRGAGSGSAPGPDASSWLFATATGMLLLLGAGHLIHARQRHTATIAR